MKIAITGHRPGKSGIDYDLTGPTCLKVKSKIIEIINKEKPDKLISGMALGVDTLFALIALELKIPLIAAIPCINQDKFWTPKSKELYNYILSQPLVEKELISVGIYTPDKMQKRNIWMVDNCDRLIAVWDGTYGGTCNCVQYANKVKKEIIRINPLEL